MNLLYQPIRFKNVNDREKYFKDVFTPILGELVVGTLIDKGFLTQPASTKYHGAYEGGLFDHSLNVAATLATITRDLGLSWVDGEASPWRVGILHDICKIDEYQVTKAVDDNGVAVDMYKRSDAAIIKGHGTKSVIYSQAWGARLNEEERACIVYHMGAFTSKEEWQSYNQAVHRYPNVLWTHTADMVASQIMEV